MSTNLSVWGQMSLHIIFFKRGQMSEGEHVLHSCTCPLVCLFVYLSACISSICLNVYFFFLPACLSVCMFLSVCLPAYMSLPIFFNVYPSVYLFVCLSVIFFRFHFCTYLSVLYLSYCTTTGLSVCLSVCHCISLSTFQHDCLRFFFCSYTYLSACLLVWLSVCLTACMFTSVLVCLSVCLLVCLPLTCLPAVVVVVVVCNFFQCLENFTLIDKCPYFNLLTCTPPILRNVYLKSFKNLVRLQCRA